MNIDYFNLKKKYLKNLDWVNGLINKLKEFKIKIINNPKIKSIQNNNKLFIFKVINNYKKIM